MAYFYIIKQPSATWTADDPVLLDNQVGVEENLVNGINLDSGKSKLGDGQHKWSELEYWSPNDQDGNVVGPATSTANAAAVFADTTGQLLADGASVNVLGRRFVENFTTTATAAGTTVLTVNSNPIQEFTGTTTQTVTLPVVTTLPKTGFQFVIINNSTGAVTVNSSGGNAVQVVAADGTAIITCVLLTGTGAASWNSSYILSGGGIGGSTGATDNAVLRADGVGGSTLQASPVSIADTTGVISGTQGVTFTGSSSGTTALVPTAAASGTITLPAATGTVALTANLPPFTAASSSSSASLAFAEDTDNGAHAVTLKAPAAVTADVDVTLPDAAGTLALVSETVARTWTVVESAAASVSPTAADSGTYYRLTHATPVFNLPTADLVVGNTEFWVTFVGNGDNTINAGTGKTVDVLAYDGAAFSGQAVENALLYGYKLCHFKYVATNVWVSDAVALT